MSLGFSLKTSHTNSILFCIWINMLYPKALFYSLRVCVSLFIKTCSGWSSDTCHYPGAVKRSQVVCSRSLIFLLKIKPLISLSRFNVFEPCKWLPLRHARCKQLWAVLLEKRVNGWLFLPYFLPLLSSVVSIHVIFLQQQAPVDGFWPGLPQYKDFWMFRDKLGQCW